LAGCARVTCGEERDDEEAVCILVESIRREDPAGKSGSLVVIAGRQRCRGESACGTDEKGTGALPGLGRPVFVEVQWEVVAPIQLHDPAAVLGLGGCSDIGKVEVDLAQIDAYGVAIGNYSTAQDSPHGRELHGQTGA